VSGLFSLYTNSDVCRLPATAVATPGDPSQVDPPSATVNPSTTLPFPPALSATRKSPPVVAFAVPLSVVAAILLVAGGLSLHHRKMLRKEQACEKEKVLLSRKASLTSFKSSSTQSDVEQALHVLSRNGLSYGSDHYTEYRRRPRESTRQPFPAYASSLCRSTRTASYNGKRARPLRSNRPSSSSRNSAREHFTAPSARSLVGHSNGSETSIDSIILDYFRPPSPSIPQALHTRREVEKSAHVH
jgi:hypothetical protein